MGKQRRRFVANLEQMEGRLLMSAAPQYTITDLGTVYTSEHAGGINSSGQIASAIFHSPVPYAFDSAVSGPNGSSQLTQIMATSLGSVGRAINDSGQAVGYIIHYDPTISSNVWNAFLYSRGTTTEFTRTNSDANDINNNGSIVGRLYNPPVGGTDGSQDAFFYSNGTTINLGNLGQEWSSANAINDSNQIVGYSNVSSGTSHAFFYSDGTMRDLGTLDGVYSVAYDVNSSGQVAGEFGDYEINNKAFLSDPNGGALHSIPMPSEFTVSTASSVNDSGETVGSMWMQTNGADISMVDGWFTTTNTIGRSAFVYVDGQTYDLNSLIPSNFEFKLVAATGVNNSGQIAVIATSTTDSDYHELLLTPVPPAPVAPTITWSNPADIVYGTPISSTQLNATADVAGTFTYDVAEGTVLHAGAAQAIHATFTPTDTEHYTTATAEAFLNVTPAPLTVTANNVSRVWGQPNPTLSGTVTGLVNGDTDVATYTTTATINSPAGTYPITPALVDSNYDITLVPGTLTVTPVLTNTGVSFGAGVIRIDGTRDSGDNTEIHIDPTTGNVQVTLNGFTIQYVASSVTMIQYIGSPGGYDTFTNRTGVMSYVAASGNYNSFTSGPGVSVWQLYGIGNSIADDGGTNYVYRHGHAVTETGTGVFINMS